MSAKTRMGGEIRQLGDVKGKVQTLVTYNNES